MKGCRMATLIAEKLAQAESLVAASGVDAWLTFDRETAESGDPVLPFLIEGGLTWQSALIVTRQGRRPRSLTRPASLRTQ